MAKPKPVVPIKVVFRKFRETGDIIALFPSEPGDYSAATCSSYIHVGQHGSAEPFSVIEDTVPAKPSEYVDLWRELRQVGYRLKVGLRCTRKDYEIRKAVLQATRTTSIDPQEPR